MSDGIIWFVLSCKRQLKKISFFVILFMIPILLTAVSGMEQAESEGIRIALYGTKGLGMETAEKLESFSGAFSFYMAESEEQLKQDVETGRAECGYVFPDDLEERMKENDFRRCIQIYSSPSSVLGPLTEEVVFSAMIEEYSPRVLSDYGESLGWDTEETRRLYEKYLSNGSTFSFEYESASGGAAEENTFSMTFPGRGIGAVLLFITGIFAASGLAEDEKKGLFLSISQSKRWKYCFLGILAPVLMESAALLASLCMTGAALDGACGLGKEAAALAVYGSAIAAFCTALKGILKTPEALIGSVPFFMIGSLALCPVFIDAGRWIPALDQAGKLFLPYYYLHFFG